MIQILHLVGALGVLLGALVALLHLLRRMGYAPSLIRPVRSLELLERTGVGPRQGVALLRVGERVLVLGVGDGGVRVLSRLTEEESQGILRSRMPQEALAGEGTTVSFKEHWKQALSRSVGVRGAASPALLLALVVGAGLLFFAAPLLAQTSPATLDAVTPKVQMNLGGKGDGLYVSGAVGMVVLMGLMAVLPALVLMMTSFTRILIVFNLLRQALGTQNVPPAHLMAALALVLTGFIMRPTLDRVNETALQPFVRGEITQTQALETGAGPFREFMLQHTREEELALFIEMAGMEVETPEEVPTIVLASAFATSELKSAFIIGFLLFIPFIVVDLIVASVLMSLGMFMLPPVLVSLPFKLLLFVLADGWFLLIQGLVNGYRG